MNRKNRRKKSNYEELITFVYLIQAALVKYAEEKYGKLIAPSIKISVAKNARSSYYSILTDTIHYNLDNYINSYHGKQHSKEFTFFEYDHISNDKVIGNAKGSWKTVFASLIAHEYAHTVDNWVDGWPHVVAPAGFSSYKPKTRREKIGHGENWQIIYSDFRSKFVNNGFAEQL